MKKAGICVAGMLIAMLMACGDARKPGVVSVMDFGAAGDLSRDDTEAFQRAMDSVTEVGGIVHVPVGQYRIDDTLRIPDNTTLKGSWEGPHSTPQDVGTTLYAYAGRDNEDGPPFISIGWNATLQGVAIFYPEQRGDDVRPYPWTINIERAGRPNVIDVTLINSYNGIRTMGACTYLRNIFLSALRRGVFTDQSFGIGRYENVHIGPFPWWNARGEYEGSDDGSRAYALEHLEGFIIGKCDWHYMNNCFVIWAKAGFRFFHSPGWPSGEPRHPVKYRSNIMVTQSGSDMAPVAVHVEHVQEHAGIAFENCQFMNGVLIEEGNTGPVKFSNCGFWGETYTGKLEGRIVRNYGSGELMFANCHFSTWEDPKRTELVWDMSIPIMENYNGTFILNGCVLKTFGHRFDNHILIEDGTEAARIMGTVVNGDELRVVNHAGSRTVLYK